MCKELLCNTYIVCKLDKGSKTPASSVVIKLLDKTMSVVLV